MNDGKRLLDAIDPILYGDAFDCAVSFDEVLRFARTRCDAEALSALLAHEALEGVIAKTDGFYTLLGREALAARRGERRERAHNLSKRARRVARILRHAPFVRGVVLTGSVAAEDADENADVDVLLVVADGQLPFAFAVLAPISRLLSRSVFCPNYYLSESHLRLERQDHYVAREIAQAKVLVGDDRELLRANQWVLDTLPNLRAANDNKTATLELGRVLQALVEMPLRAAIAVGVGQWAHRLVLSRLDAHYRTHGSTVPERVRERFEAGIELRFHGGHYVKGAMERYQANLEEAEQSLARALSRAPESASPPPQRRVT